VRRFRTRCLANDAYVFNPLLITASPAAGQRIAGDRTVVNLKRQSVAGQGATNVFFLSVAVLFPFDAKKLPNFPFRKA